MDRQLLEQTTASTQKRAPSTAGHCRHAPLAHPRGTGFFPAGSRKPLEALLCQALLHHSPSQLRGHVPQHQFVRAI